MGCLEKSYEMDTIPALYDIRTTIFDRFTIFLWSFEGVKPWKLQLNLTFEPLVGFQSVLHQNGVPQEILRIGLSQPKGAKNGCFSAILGLNSTV